MKRLNLCVLALLLQLGVSFGVKSVEKCAEYADNFKDKIKPSIPLAGPFSVLGKEPTNPGEFPHMAALGFGPSNNIEWKCGGNLISDEYILTTGVCTNTPQDGAVAWVRLGDMNLTSDVDDSEVQQFGVAKIIKHPDYNPPMQYNDIALLKLDKKVRFTKFVRPACLNINADVSNAALVATGWGKPSVHEEPSDTLLKVYLELFTNEECGEIYKRISKRRLKNGIISSQLCAGGRNIPRDTCSGDSGGPIQVLKANTENIYDIIGLVSFGVSCGIVGMPGVYTRVSHYVPWIESIVWS